jgi:hypothetical protein
MSIRGVLSIGLVAATLSLSSSARAEQKALPSGEPSESAQACTHHLKAMHGMSTDKQREAYCHAHKDCMSHDCGGMGAHGHEHGPVDPSDPKAQPKAPPIPPKN